MCVCATADGVGQTETIMNNHKPVYRPFSVDLAQLCNGNMDQPFLVECYDWDANGNHVSAVARMARCANADK